MGPKVRSGELLVGTEEGIVKARSWCKRLEEDRWNKVTLNGIRGVLWGTREETNRLQNNNQ